MATNPAYTVNRYQVAYVRDADDSTLPLVHNLTLDQAAATRKNWEEWRPEFRFRVVREGVVCEMDKRDE